MEVKEIIKKLSNQGFVITAPFDNPNARRIDGEFTLDNQGYDFKAYVIMGVRPTIRIDIQERG